MTTNKFQVKNCTPRKWCSCVLYVHKDAMKDCLHQKVLLPFRTTVAEALGNAQLASHCGLRSRVTLLEMPSRTTHPILLLGSVLFCFPTSIYGILHCFSLLTDVWVPTEWGLTCFVCSLIPRVHGHAQRTAGPQQAFHEQINVDLSPFDCAWFPWDFPVYAKPAWNLFTFWQTHAFSQVSSTCPPLERSVFLISWVDAAFTICFPWIPRIIESFPQMPIVAV